MACKSATSTDRLSESEANAVATSSQCILLVNANSTCTASPENSSTELEEVNRDAAAGLCHCIGRNKTEASSSQNNGCRGNPDNWMSADMYVFG